MRLTRSQKQPSSVMTMIRGNGRSSAPGMEKTWTIAQTIGATVASLAQIGAAWDCAPLRRIVLWTPKRCEMRIHQPHRWTFERKAWRCILCSRVAKRRTQHNRPPPGKCPNERNAEHHEPFSARGRKGQGHVTWGAFHGSLSIFLLCALRSACGMVHAQPGSEVQRSSSLRQTARGFAAVCSRGLHPKTGVCLGERAPVDLFLHRCGSALAPADALELDPRCAHRMRAVKKCPISCRCVLCSQTA